VRKTVPTVTKDFHNESETKIQGRIGYRGCLAGVGRKRKNNVKNIKINGHFTNFMGVQVEI